MPDHDLTLWNTSAADHQRKVAQRVAAAPAPKLLGKASFAFANLANLTDADFANLTRDIDRDRCIYTIEASPDVDLDALRDAFRGHKGDEKASTKLPQDNPQASSRFLYVGSSCATKQRSRTLQSRLKQHLVQAPKGTYALNLSLWAGDQPGGVIVRAYQYPPAADGKDQTAREVVLAVEDWLSSELQPLFGRRGSRN